MEAIFRRVEQGSRVVTRMWYNILDTPSSHLSAKEKFFQLFLNSRNPMVVYG